MVLITTGGTDREDVAVVWPDPAPLPPTVTELTPVPDPVWFVVVTVVAVEPLVTVVLALAGAVAGAVGVVGSPALLDDEPDETADDGSVAELSAPVGLTGGATLPVGPVPEELSPGPMITVASTTTTVASTTPPMAISAPRRRVSRSGPEAGMIRFGPASASAG
jgi:hypothetical protein